MWLYIHVLVAIGLLVKLSPAIFDYLDVFILQLEEQNIPKPLLWEWVWFGGTFLLFLIGANAIKASKVGKIQIFNALVFLLGVLPILYVVVIFYPDAYAYMYDRPSKIYQTWKGLPVAILWYIFALVALNIHFWEIYYGFVLKDAWNIKRKKA